MSNDAFEKMMKLSREMKGGNVTAKDVTSANKASKTMFTDAHFEPLLSDCSLAESLGIKQLTHSITTKDGVILNISIRTAVNKEGRTELNGEVVIIKQNGTVVHTFVWDAIKYSQAWLNSFKDDKMDLANYRKECMGRGVDYNFMKNDAVTAVTAAIRKTFEEKGIDMFAWLGNKADTQTSGFNGFDPMAFFNGQTTNTQPIINQQPIINSTNKGIEERLNELEEENNELKHYLEEVLHKNKEFAKEVEELKIRANSINTLPKETETSTSTSNTATSTVETSNNDKAPVKEVNSGTSIKNATKSNREYSGFAPANKNRKHKRLEEVDFGE